MAMTEQKNNQMRPLFETMEQRYRTENAVLEHNTGFFLIVALIYSVGFAVAFYKNYASVTFPLIIVGTLIICGLFLQKSEILWKTQNLYYIVPIVLLGISTMLTTNLFTIFFNTVGILLLITVFMMQQVYSNNEWGLKRYIGNTLFLYLSMIPEIAAPFSNLGKYIRRKRVREQKNTNTKYIVTGVLIGFPMLIFVVILLNSADVIFADYIGKIFRVVWENIVLSPNIVLIVGLMLIGFFGIYTFLSALTLNNLPSYQKEREKKNPIIAITFTVMITVIYLIYSIIQVIFLFSGGMILPEGYTYAEYAHQGFFQLLFLCIFNLILVLCCMSLFEMNRWLKTILMVFSGCTYVMIASSAYRMILYISCYHLTFLRMLVLWFLALLVVLLAGVMWSICKKKFPLFRFEVAVITVFYLVLSFSHFDYWIAKYNISQMGDQLEYEDVSYLCNLSFDAAPVLGKISAGHNNIEYSVKGQRGFYEGCYACELETYFEQAEKNTDLNIRTFNLSKYQAVKAAEEYLGK